MKHLTTKSSHRRRWQRTASATAILALLSGCSLKKMAVNSVGDMLAEGSITYATDDDPELVAQALPFALKMIESLLIQTPDNPTLLLAAASGFTQYAYAFAQLDADELEDRDLAAATALRGRAVRLYLRARDYGLRGLDATHDGFTDRFRREPRTALDAASIDDVPLLYWTAASWGSAISLSKDRPDLVADQLAVEALLDRALELDETFSNGAIHAALIGYEFSRQGRAGDPVTRARHHFDRAVELTDGQSAGPFVSYAESVTIHAQDRAAFTALLHRALAIDPGVRPEWRLANLLAQRRARWLLGRADELFVADAPSTAGSNRQASHRGD
jgi:predicted anti-sigma-YlaC factor YlaD